MKNTTQNTPAHCHGCHKFDDCLQAQNMMADTLPVTGYVSSYGVYCVKCAAATNIIYCGESDSPTLCGGCGGCGVPIIHELTAEGVEYVREHLADGNGCCQEVWPTVWGITPKIPVDSIEIPCEYVDLCEGWAGGTDCMLRAVSSTGNLTIGNIRPRGCDTDEKWYYHLWLQLSSDVGYAARLTREGGDEHGDADDLAEFEEWVDEQCERLCESYGLEDWDQDD